MNHHVITVGARYFGTLAGICVCCMASLSAIAEPQDPPYLTYERLHKNASYAIIYNHQGRKLQVEELQDVKWRIIQQLNEDPDEACTAPKVACSIDGVTYCRKTCP